MLLFMIAILILLPAIFLIMLSKTSYQSKFEWLLNALLTAILIVWLFQTGNWSWVGYYFRYLLLAILILVVIVSWRKVRGLPFKITYTRSQKFSLSFTVLLIAVFSVYNILVFTSYSTDDEAIELSFPLKEGTYYIGQGGNHTQMNYHHAYEPQQYALDILKINKLGFRAKGLSPKELEKYQIYEDNLYSPCHGTVVETENDLPDLIPPETDAENATGNHVALSCDNTDATIYIAHMLQDSVKVKKGDTVTEGQEIGKVGNTGNTTEPHLHIHAEKDGVGIPIRFNDRFLVRNSIVR